MKKSHINAIDVIYKKNLDTVNFNQSWQYLHREYDVGEVLPCGKKLHLSRDERNYLFEMANKQGIDFTADDYRQAYHRSRTEAAATSNDEKPLAHSPRAQHLEVRSLQYNVGQYRHAPDGYLGIRIDELLQLAAQSAFHRVITVENFDTFLSLQADDLSILSPAISLQENNLLIYRGDNIASPSAVLALLPQLSQPIIHFGDFDAYGINIGLKLPGVQQLVLPDLQKVPIEILAGLSKKEIFIKQESHLKNLMQSTQCPSVIVPLLEIMLTHRLAVTQESMMAHHIPLKIYPLMTCVDTNII